MHFLIESESFRNEGITNNYKEYIYLFISIYRDVVFGLNSLSIEIVHVFSIDRK